MLWTLASMELTQLLIRARSALVRCSMPGRTCEFSSPKLAMQRINFSTLLLPYGSTRTPGNTIRKVYLCRSPTTQIRPGDLLFFYMSKSQSLVASQCITTVGVAEQVTTAASLEEPLRKTAKRSVYSLAEQEALVRQSSTPVKDRLPTGSSLGPVRATQEALGEGILNNVPRSITRFSEQRYRCLRPLLSLGFEN